MIETRTLYNKFLASDGISTDSRTVKGGQMFFALKGPNFNGNLYARKALELGAKYCVVDEAIDIKSDRLIYVDDGLKTLQELARFHRRELNIPIIAITGSNGKTTTKELLAACLSSKYKTQWTKGNLNNHIGVPLTILSLEKDCEIGIVEMGANHQGEIAELAKIAEPTHGLITNIGLAHLEGFGGPEGVLKGKFELFQYLIENEKTIFLNTNEDDLVSMIGEYPLVVPYNYNSLSYDSTENGNLYFDDINKETKLVGSYNIKNIAAAESVSIYFEITKEDTWRGICDYDPDNNRSQFIKKSDQQFILDAYNANPSSMEASISSFAASNFNTKVLILGEMKELGKYWKKEHDRILKLVEQLKFEKVWLIGELFSQLSFPSQYKHFKNVDDLVKWYNDSFQGKGYTFFVKGSRSNQLERFIKEID